MNREQLAYRVPEFAKLISISRAKAYAAVASGEIPSIRLGRVVLVPADALKRLLDATQVEAR